MKKVAKCLFPVLMACLLSPNMVTGQGSNVLYSYNENDIERNIIRYHPGMNKYINTSNCHVNTGMHISLTDLTSMIDAYFEEKYEIHDVEIVGDLVFFCGKYNSTLSGFLGWFEVNDLFYNSVPVYVDNTLSTYGLQSLDNIEIFTAQNGEIHIVGYGLHSPLPWIAPNTYKAFEAVGTLGTGIQYRVADMYNGGKMSDITDLVVTDNFVVYLGTTRNQICNPHFGVGINLQVFPKYNMFSGTHFAVGHFQTITSHYLYAGGCGHLLNDNSDPEYGYAKMVHIDEDRIAVCTHRVDFDYSAWTPFGCDPANDCGFGEFPSAYYLAHRIYDISPILINQPMVMQSAYTATLPGQPISIDCLEYDGNLKHFIVQHRFTTALGTVETAFTTIDYSSGTMPLLAVSDFQIVCNTSACWFPECLHQYGIGDYVVSGRTTSYNDHFFWKSHVGNDDGSCNLHQYYPLKMIPTQEIKDNRELIVSTAWTPLTFFDLSPKYLEELEQIIICN